MGVTKQQGFLGLETVSSNFSKNQVLVWSSLDRSFCIRSIPSARKSSFLETRPTQQGGGCNATKPVSSIRINPICSLPFLFNSRSFTQYSTGPGSYNDTCKGSLAGTILIPQASTNINNQSNHHTSQTKPTAKYTKGGSFISGKYYFFVHIHLFICSCTHLREFSRYKNVN